MEIFDILGPVMVGPSSSHTAGVVRVANITRSMLGDDVKNALIKFHGSLAKTFKGHGSDLAVIAGLMGFAADDERINDSFRHAGERGMSFSFETVALKDAHPNTLIIEAESFAGKKITVEGESIGGGNVIIKKIDGLAVEFSGKYNTLLIRHQDVPGAISLVTSLLMTLRINIAGMRVFRSERGGNAIMVIETDEDIKKEYEAVFEALPNIISARIV